MKIRAVRLAECGRFATPVALEGLSGRLDILAEPNEFGKSTLLKAVRLALTEKHTSSATHIKSLQPYGGGAPQIEIDFDCGAETWRLRKRFVSQRKAELTPLGGGGTLRGDEAETRLAALLGHDNGKNQLPLLWVAQGDALAPLAVGDKARPLLDHAIAQEMQAIAGGSATRRISEIVRDRLLELLTNTGRPKVRGRYDLALKSVDELTSKRDDANRRVAAARAQRDALAGVREREAALRHPEHRRKLEVELGTARKARTEATDAASHLAAARTAQEREKSAVATARGELERIERSVATRARLQARLGEIAVRHQGITAALTAMRPHVEQATAASEAIRAAVSDAERALDAARRQARAQELRTQHAVASERLTKAREIDAERASAAAEANAIVASEGLLDEVRRDHTAVELMAARLSASSATLSIQYQPGQAGRVRIAGQSLASDTRHEVSAPTEVEIEGIGRLTIVPGGATDLATVRHQLADLRDKLARSLARSGCDSLEALAEAAARRRRLVGKANELAARLEGLAPRGLDALAAEIAKLAQQLATCPGEDASPAARTVADCEAALLAEKARLAPADSAAAKLAGEARNLERDEAQTGAECAALQRQLDELGAELPAGEAVAALRSSLAARLAEAQARLDEADRGVALWSPRAPDAAGLAALTRAEETAVAAIRGLEADLSRLETEAAGLEGGLRASGHDDVEAVAGALSERLADARDELARVEDEVAGLRMLEKEIQAIEADVRDRYQAPVLQRLQPYLDMVFPGGALTLDGKLVPTELKRGLGAESIEKLSDGTREQIAVLGRLAFARLLADAGHDVPLILDDALVFSDDERLGAMFKALERASTAHQVIVLTCRMRAFDGLAGTRVRMQPWRPD